MSDLSTLPPLKQVIHDHELLARKSLGQHFLLDGSITGRIAQAAGDLTGCSTIEVGPGPGGLTRSLLAAGAKKLFVIEKDDRCIAIMQQIRAAVGDRLEIIHGDAMETDLMSIPAPRKIVANLPYNAGTPMLIGWLAQLAKNAKAFESMTLMFQKEVADRIMAVPRTKDFGRLSVITQWLCDVRHEFDLPPGAFMPPPKVSSSVITLIPRAKPLVDVPMEAVEKVAASAFGQRRKMLRQALKTLRLPVDALLEKAGIDGSLRAEQLDVKTLCELAHVYQSVLTKPLSPS